MHARGDTTVRAPNIKSEDDRLFLSALQRTDAGCRRDGPTDARQLTIRRRRRGVKKAAVASTASAATVRGTLTASGARDPAASSAFASAA